MTPFSGLGDPKMKVKKKTPAAPAKATPPPTSGATKRLAPAAVNRSDQARVNAEQVVGKRGPGRPRKDGSPAQPRNIQAIAADVKNRQTQVQAQAEADSWHEPSKANVRRCALMIRQANKPLGQTEKELLRIQGVTGLPLIEPGELVLSDDEVEFGSEMTAGTLMAVSPNIARYIPVVGLIFWGLSIVISRGIVMYRVKSTIEMAKAMQTQGQTPAPGPNGTIVPMPTQESLAPR